MTPEKQLLIIDDMLEELLLKGSNDEKLVDRKRELEQLLRALI